MYKRLAILGCRYDGSEKHYCEHRNLHNCIRTKPGSLKIMVVPSMVVEWKTPVAQNATKREVYRQRKKNYDEWHRRHEAMALVEECEATWKAEARHAQFPGRAAFPIRSLIYRADRGRSAANSTG